ncbi:Omega-6 fatty acid desaturase, endoplasmic reticulum [Heracleum sosnowskyi]|uniref:Omega-6 fatty acid desaturase, endoplasmic reticulum n=1 Tax=Heracleum sosnowskyi TaxID=360622 RepID=A0AAD8GM66_9APIA|nr:Omega-6 fatty acid desaturase, endoplasmic reticulum [Heracleum sosnowskyi]
MIQLQQYIQKTSEARQARNILEMDQKLGSAEKKESRVPSSKPPFTLGDLKKAIPPHCFKRHECGHNAFSEYKWLDDIVGFTLHSFLLFPYFPFKYSHHRHHIRTGSLEQEELSVPLLKSQVPFLYKHLTTHPAPRFLVITLVSLFGVPLYLLVNFRGRAYGRFASHFYPFSPMFLPNQRTQIVLSDVAFLAMVYGLNRLVLMEGFAWVAFVYGGPYLFLMGTVFIVAFLQHTHPLVPYYDFTEWDWLRGSLSTIDRNYGILDTVFYQVTNTHVAHHLFATIPHYHALEATRAIKPLLGEYYRYDDTKFYKSLWNAIKECVYVEEDEGGENKGIYWYNNQL